MKTTTKWIALALVGGVSFGTPATLSAQSDSAAAAQEVNSPKGGTDRVLLAGEAFTLWQSNHINAFNGAPSVSNNSFGADPLGLMLMPLVKINDRLFLDAQIEVDANPAPGGGASASLNEAIIYYRVAPAAYLFAGNFQPRGGLYEGILDDFTNRFGTDPIGMGIASGGQSGIGLQGGFQAGTTKFNYQIYAANGPQLIVDSSGASNSQVFYDNYTDNNKNKAFGGSLGFLPLANSELEIGVSGQYTPKTGDAGSGLESINNTCFAAYLNYFHVFNPLMIRIQGQYEMNQTQSFSLKAPGSDSVIVPSFTNQTTGWYGGLTLRLSGSQNKFLSNLELAGRMGQLTVPQDVNCMWTQKPINQTTVCLTYWFTWKTPINIAYDIYTQSGSPTQSTVTVRGMWFF